MAMKGKCFESSRLWVIGVIGFEPTASCSQSRRSSQAELHPDNNCFPSILHDIPNNCNDIQSIIIWCITHHLEG